MSSVHEPYDREADLQELKYVVIHMECCFRTLEAVVFVGIREIDIEESCVLFEEITKAVNCINQKGVIHRDFKPVNIFFGLGGTMKISDFGHACWAQNQFDGQGGTPNRGTHLYVAPELEKEQDVTNKVNIYSLGVIFVELFHVFKSGQERLIVLLNLRRSIYPTDWEGDTVLLKQLTALCPSHRPSSDEILEYIARRTLNCGLSG